MAVATHEGTDIGHPRKGGERSSQIVRPSCVAGVLPRERGAPCHGRWRYLRARPIPAWARTHLLDGRTRLLGRLIPARAGNTLPGKSCFYATIRDLAGSPNTRPGEDRPQPCESAFREAEAQTRPVNSIRPCPKARARPKPQVMAARSLPGSVTSSTPARSATSSRIGRPFPAQARLSAE